MNIATIKEEICSIGRRVCDKGFAAANEGNISYRISENEILCTPSLQSKGLLSPCDICTVDMQGNQIAGGKKRTSEILLHLEIYRNRPDVKSVVHCHPPHATAFAITGEPVPVCLLPEPDIFLGEVPIAPYSRPGTQEFAETVAPFAGSTNTVILANHGTVTYDVSLERAFWWTDILDAYCRILILSRQIGPVKYLSREEGRELLDLRLEWGFDDKRHDLEGDVREFLAFRDKWDASGLKQSAFPIGAEQDSDAKENSDDLVERIALRVVELLKNQNSNS